MAAIVCQALRFYTCDNRVSTEYKWFRLYKLFILYKLTILYKLFILYKSKRDFSYPHCSTLLVLKLFYNTQVYIFAGMSEIEADVIKLYLNGSGRDRDNLHQRPQFAAVDSFLSAKKRCSLQVFTEQSHTTQTPVWSCWQLSQRQETLLLVSYTPDRSLQLLTASSKPRNAAFCRYLLRRVIHSRQQCAAVDSFPSAKKRSSL